MSFNKIAPHLVKFDNGAWILDHPFAKNGGAALIVTADWCGHCQKLKQTIPQAQQLNQFTVFELDGGDESPEMQKKLAQLGVQGFPTIFYLDRDGKLYTYEESRAPEAMAKVFHK